jgi:mRNA interferase MazF
MVVKQYEIYLLNLDPTIGSEIKKIGPCVVISPDEMNLHLNTVIIAPMTSATKSYPSRVKIDFQNKIGQIALDQIKTIDKSRMIKKMGKINKKTIEMVKQVIQEMLVDY